MHKEVFGGNKNKNRKTDRFLFVKNDKIELYSFASCMIF